MAFEPEKFWAKVAAIRDHAERGEASAARRALKAARVLAAADIGNGEARRLAVINELARAYRLEPAAPKGVNAPAAPPPPGGISVVTACRNRNENLKRALPTWLGCSEVSEVVIVDWSSTPAIAGDLADSGRADDRIRVIRVEDEPRWVLSYAFNLGFKVARFATVLKADADIVIEPDFFRRNPLRPGAFLAGNWRTAETGQGFVNGFFLINRHVLAEAGGFNEFITSYGWDDEELYARLAEQGLVREDVAPGSIRHLDHDDAARVERPRPDADGPAAQTLASDTTFLIRRNRYIANAMPAWSEAQAVVSYEELDDTPGLRRVRRVEASGRRVPDAIAREADLAAAREMMSWRLGEPCLELSLDQVEALVSRLSWDALRLEDVRAAVGTSRAGDLARAIAGPRTEPAKLFIDAQHGLGNRLRAIASAAAIARAEGRELVIVWRPDHHCDCRFEDLFEYSGPVRTELDPDQARKQGATVYNYMELEPGAEKDAPIALEPERNLFVRSAFVLNHPASHWEEENLFLKSLTPNEAVRALIDSVRSPSEVGVHVRMAGGKAYEHLAWESPDNWSLESHNAVARWRAQSRPERFLARLESLVSEGRAGTIFVAADLPEVYADFEHVFGGRAAFLKREVNDRSVDQLRYALADAVLLGRTRLLLGSTWSSFSELAMRLAEPGQVVEMSGRDF